MLQRPSILIVSKTESSMESLRQCLSDPGLTLHAKDCAEASKLLREQEAGVLILELDVAGDKAALVAEAKAADKDTQILVLGAEADRALSSQCLKRGASELLPRPCDPEQLRAATDRANEVYELRQLLKRWQAPSGRQSDAEMLGSSGVMRAFIDRAVKLAAHDATVLITGEAGSGKNGVARLIHSRSRRSNGRFVALEAAALGAEAQSAALAGVDGENALGAFEAASQGTLYIHDVDMLGAHAQERLLKAVKEGESTRQGSSRLVRVDMRVISSSRENLRSLVHAGRFREDLYWALAGVALEVPALRERPGDARELFFAFLERESRHLGKRNPKVEAAVAKAVDAYSFPGNVSELKHLAGLLAALAENGEVSFGMLPAQMMAPVQIPRSAPAGALALKPIVHEFEKQFLIRTLKAVGGNQSKAARVLDIHRNTLILKMQELGIPNRRSKGRAVRPA